MAVALQDVRTVARLARLELSAEEEEKLAGELSRILQYMEKLNQLDTSGVEPTAHVLPVEGSFRADTVVPFAGRQALLDAAPQRHNGYYRVPRIID
ncbi:MAG: Asp-tRNA(Asn)/Glu-tRNA(Gln) amidotransferase subunit GatC [Candidatus Latescibacterota bacterium]